MASTATVNSCAPATATGDTLASEVNSVAVSSPTIFNYPRQPARDDGRLLALASLVGGFLDAVLGGGGIGAAKDAEGKWKSICDDLMYPRGRQELQRVDTERAKLAPLEQDLTQQLADYRAKADLLWPKLAPYESKVDARLALATSRADADFAKLPQLDQVVHDAIDRMATLANEAEAHAKALCTDEAFDRLCEFVACGYVPDYEAIATRARADAELSAAQAYADACRLSNRYNVRNGVNTAFDVRMQTVQAAISGTAMARETERQFAFKTNEDMRFKHSELLERTRLGRQKFAFDASSRQQDLALKHWEAHARLADATDARVIETLRARWQDIAKLYMETENRGDALSEVQWRAFSESAFKSLREGGEMLAAAAQAYQFLAASIRATAKQGGAGSGGITSVLATLATLYPMFNGSCTPTTLFGLEFNSRPKDCGCATTPAA